MISIRLLAGFVLALASNAAALAQTRQYIDITAPDFHPLPIAVANFQAVGDSAAQAAELRFEIAFCERYLPKGMDETALRALVAERLQTLGISDAK